MAIWIKICILARSARSATGYLFSEKYRNNVFQCDLYRALSRVASQNSLRPLFFLLSALGLGRPPWLLVLACIERQKHDHQKAGRYIRKICDGRIRLTARCLNYVFVRELFSELVDSGVVGKELANVFCADSLYEKLMLYKFYLANVGYVAQETIFGQSLDLADSAKLQLLDLASIEDVASDKIICAPSGKYVFQDPQSYGDNSARRTHELKVPEECVWTVNDASVLEGFQLVKGQQFVVYEPSADPRNGFVAGIWNFVTKVKGADNVLVESSFCRTVEIPVGTLLSGRCTRNYFHWLIEYLPKLLNVIDAKFLTVGSLIVDSEMPKQHYELLEFLAQKFRLEVLRVAPGTLLNVRQLNVPSPSTFHPDDSQFEYWQGGVLSAPHLGFIREAGLAFAEAKRATRWPNRVLLLRKSNTRRIVNEAEIESIAMSYGFVSVDPAMLDFVDQVNLFNGAEVLVSPAGAGLSNIVFMSPGATVISLLADINKAYCIKSNIAESVGVHFFHLTGSLVRSRDNFETFDEYRFSEFSIDTGKLRKALSEVTRERPTPISEKGLDTSVPPQSQDRQK